MFPCLMNDEYEVWAMKMEHWITNNDMNIWKVIQNGVSPKFFGRDHNGKLFVLPPTTAEEHIEVQARDILLKSIPVDHVADFHHMNDAREIWKAIKARYGGKNDSKEVRKGASTLGVAADFAFMGISPQVHDCVFGCDVKYNALKQAYDEMEPKYNTCFVELKAYKRGVQTLEEQKIWFQENQLAYEEKIRVLERDLLIYTNKLECSECEKAKIEVELQELKVKFEDEVAGRMKWQEGTKSLNRIITSSQSTRSRRALGFGDYLNPNEAYDPNESSVLDPDPPLQFQTPVKYVKQGEMHTVSPTITGTFMPTSECLDQIESQLGTGKKPPTSPATSSVSSSSTNELVSCSISDKSTDLESTNYASCDSSDKSFPPKSKVNDNEPKHKTVSLKENLVHSVKTNFVSSPVSDKFTCNKQSCVKNKSFKKKTCFVCGSKSHLIKDCDFHEKRMGVCADQKRPRPTWTNVASIPPFVPKATHVKTSKSNSAGKPVSVGRPFPTGWKRHVARPYYRPTSTYFQNGYWPGYCDPMYMGWDRWGTGVKPSTGCSWKTHKKDSFWVPKNSSPCQVH